MIINESNLNEARTIEKNGNQYYQYSGKYYEKDRNGKKKEIGKDQYDKIVNDEKSKSNNKSNKVSDSEIDRQYSTNIHNVLDDKYGKKYDAGFLSKSQKFNINKALSSGGHHARKEIRYSFDKYWDNSSKDDKIKLSNMKPKEIIRTVTNKDPNEIKRDGSKYDREEDSFYKQQVKDDHDPKAKNNDDLPKRTKNNNDDNISIDTNKLPDNQSNEIQKAIDHMYGYGGDNKKVRSDLESGSFTKSQVIKSIAYYRLNGLPLKVKIDKISSYMDDVRKEYFNK